MSQTSMKKNPRAAKHIIFFEDGTYVVGFYFKENATRDSIAKNMSGSIVTSIKDKQTPWVFLGEFTE